MSNELTDKEQRIREAANEILKKHKLSVVMFEVDSNNSHPFLHLDIVRRLIIEFSKQYHQPDNKAVDLEKLRLEFLEKTYTGGEIKTSEDLWNFFKPYIQSPPKAISDGESDAVEFLNWVSNSEYKKSDKPDYYYKNRCDIKVYITTTELYNQFKTKTK